MKHFLFKLLPALLLAGGTAAAQTTTKTYLADNSTVFLNPERGFSVDRRANHAGEALGLGDLQGVRAGGIGLVRRIYVLQDFIDVNTPISPAYLDMVAADVRTARTAGLKLVVRFVEKWADGNDAPKTRVLAHIAQLKPVLRANYDAIAYVEVGFIGDYGEWHDSSNGLVNVTDGGDILRALLGAVPAERMVALRYPRFKKQIFGNSNPLTASEAFTQTDRARVGAHNDYFLSDIADGGTYDSYGTSSADDATREAGRQFLSQDNRYVVQGGESGENVPSRSSCAKSVAELKRLRYSQLNSYWQTDVLARWQTDGCMDDIKRRLGYRFRLTSATLANSVAAGATFAASLKVKNDGFASCYNARGVEVILRNTGTGAKLVASGGALGGDKDPRFWLTDEEHTLSVSYTVPAGTPTGQYEVLLSLPDPLGSLHDRPEYAIRLANPNLWEASTGYHKLGHTLSVTAPAPPVAEFSGVYRLVARHSGKVLDVSRVSVANGAYVHQWAYVGGANQHWQVTATGNGYYKLTAQHSGKVLDVSKASTADGARVQQWTDTDNPAQRWKIEPTSDGYCKLTAQCSGKVLDVAGGPGAVANGDTVKQYGYGGGLNQQWKLEAVPASAARASALATRAPQGETGLLAYPNPSPAGRATLSLSAARAQPVRVTLYNLLGQAVATLGVAAQAGRTDVALPALPPGLYRLRATVDGVNQGCTLQVE